MSNKDSELYDVCIVGAGIAGSTCAFYLAKLGVKTLVLEKQKFPRDKICGDAITARAQIHLERMGVLQKILAEGKGHWAAIGGLVSPGGISYIGDSSNEQSHLVIAIKRKILDDMMIHTAVDQGAVLVEEYPVSNAKLSDDEKQWTISSELNDTSYKSKILIITDGSATRLGKVLGYVTESPNAICSRAYIENHEYKYDGLCYYPPKLVPGYCSLFKQANGDIGYCCYIIPGGKATIKDLKELHHEFITTDPFMSKHIGANPTLENMKAAPIRFGGIKNSYGENLMIVGDAAGHVDPLTGEGIQYAMDAAEIAAKIANEALILNTYDKEFFSKYQKLWMKSFGRDFKWSQRMINVFIKYPIFLDAFAEVCNRKGDKFMTEWGKIMTGSKKKVGFFRPKLAFPLLISTIRLKLRKKKKQ